MTLANTTFQLKKVLETHPPVGYSREALVISGEYFGWNYGWQAAGTVGFLIATIAVTLLYHISFSAIPNLLRPSPMPAGLLLMPIKLWGQLAA
jgi:ethanolamine permease